MESYSKYSSLVLRIGLGAVFLWFGFSQVLYPSQWIRFLPEWIAILGISPKTLIFLNGSLEIIAAVLLVLGFFTRVVAGLLSLHMLSVVIAVGYGPTGVRDFGIMVSLVSLFLSGAPTLSLDASNVLEKKEDVLVIK